MAATAPGKIILFGEHAVVYGRPAIAVPVTQVRARAAVIAAPAGKPGEVHIIAKDIRLDKRMDQLPVNHPLALAVKGVAQILGIKSLPSLRIEITSTIPIASGLGSGASVTVAIARALSEFLGHPLADSDISAIAFKVDQRHHGTPSGIDNTVIAYTQPVFYVRGEPFERLHPCQPFTVIIGNTGISSPTGIVVKDVNRRWQSAKSEYEHIFDNIGDLAYQARHKIEQGPVEEIGGLMNENQALLQKLDVSSQDLDRLITAALAAGAAGAKLCGGGRGGNMIALVNDENANQVASALREAGAVNTIITTINP
ncbi:MAG: mevalonate kinase [Anaerolineaceae bacterium]|nr:mevalonate kinase [Anaerolineaceae bacterium]